MKHSSVILAVVLLSGMLPLAAAADVVLHDEGVNGDLSGDMANPDSFVLSLGVNSIIATSSAGDLEYVHLSLPVGTQLSQVFLTDYSGPDGIAFIAVQAGTVFTEPPVGTDASELLGWAHFGPGVGNLGLDILPEIGTGAGSMGFAPPLTGSDYTWWIQQTGPSMVTYQLDFVLTPEPASLALLGVGGMATLRRRRQR